MGPAALWMYTSAENGAGAGLSYVYYDTLLGFGMRGLGGEDVGFVVCVEREGEV